MSAGIVPILTAAKRGRRRDLIRHLLRRKAVDAGGAIPTKECPNFDEFYSELVAKKVLVSVGGDQVYLDLVKFSDFDQEDDRVGLSNFLLFTAGVFGFFLLIIYS